MAVLGACAPAPVAGPAPGPAPVPPRWGDVRRVPGVGDVGVWMLRGTLRPATWQDQPYRSRTLREPVNVIVLDRAARTPAEATARLTAALAQAGYVPRARHPDGYWALFGSEYRPQLPRSGSGLAFSDAGAHGPNNHGRMFGPWAGPGGFVFTGAFSREDLHWLPTPRHTFTSFLAAREHLSARLSARTAYRRTATVDLGSRVDTAMTTTADHDGRAALIVAGP